MSYKKLEASLLMLWREEGTLTGIGVFFFFFFPPKNQQNIAEILPSQLIFPNKSPINRLSLFVEICRFFPVNHLFDISTLRFASLVVETRNFFRKNEIFILAQNKGVMYVKAHMIGKPTKAMVDTRCHTQLCQCGWGKETRTLCIQGRWLA